MYYYRTEETVCVGCEKRVKYRYRVADKKWAGYFPQAIGARYCYRCQQVKKCANEGDSLCKNFVNNHLGAYA